MNIKPRFAISAGSATLVMIFCVLCLTIFASLTLIGAKNEMSLAKKFASSVSEYYAADTKAEQKLQQAQNMLSEASGKAAGRQKDYITHMCGLLNFKLTAESGKMYISFKENINSSQAINVILEVDKIKNGTYTIVQWKKINTNEANIDDNLNVYK